MFTLIWSIIMVSFNSHAPAGARYRNVFTSCGFGVSIHTPPQGRDSYTFTSQFRIAVSIHTPPQGRDLNTVGKVIAGAVSIHTPPQGRDSRR